MTVNCNKTEHMSITGFADVMQFFAGNDIGVKALQVLMSECNITADDMAAKLMKNELDIVLKEKHKEKIWLASDGRWKTHVKTENGRKLIAAKNQEALLRRLCDYYSGKDEVRKNKKLTLTRLYPKWVEYRRLRGIAESTIMRAERDWKRYYEGREIANKPIKSMDWRYLDDWVHHMIRDFDMDKKQYFNCTGILNQILEYAVVQRIIKENPFKEVRVDTRRVLRRNRKKEDSTQVFTREEVHRLTEMAWKDFRDDTCKVQKLAPLAIIFLTLTGLRVGELRALKFSDITEDGTRINIRRSVQKDTGFVVDHTKGAYGDRQVLLVDRAKDIIDEARNKKMQMGLDTNGYIFSVKETPLPYDPLKELTYKYCDALGTPRKNTHNFRKTYISMLIQSGVNINTIRKMVGHCDERTTLNSYCYDISPEKEKIEMITNALR